RRRSDTSAIPCEYASRLRNEIARAIQKLALLKNSYRALGSRVGPVRLGGADRPVLRGQGEGGTVLKVLPTRFRKRRYFLGIVPLVVAAAVPALLVGSGSATPSAAPV